MPSVKITWTSFLPIVLAVLNSLLPIFPPGSKASNIINMILLVIQSLLPRVVKPAGTP